MCQTPHSSDTRLQLLVTKIRSLQAFQFPCWSWRISCQIAFSNGEWKSNFEKVFQRKLRRHDRDSSPRVIVSRFVTIFIVLVQELQSLEGSPVCIKSLHTGFVCNIQSNVCLASLLICEPVTSWSEPFHTDSDSLILNPDQTINWITLWLHSLNQ